MAETIYICSEDQHNKFWSYEISGTSVTTKWGRIGGTSDTKTKDFGSSSAAHKEVQKKIREKEKKGYKLVSKEKLADETEAAQDLGNRNKIKIMQFVSKKGETLNRLDKYDPKHFVYVEVLNSWTKDVTRLLLSKDETWVLNDGIVEEDRKYITNGMRRVGNESTFATAVRNRLKKLSKAVVEVLKTVKFAAIGNRSLFDDEEAPADAGESEELSTALAAIDSSGVESGVLTTFAAIGCRALDL